MDDAKSDLVNVLSRLEAHWVVLEAELTEINKDITQCEQCVQKYGEYFTFPLQHLKDLKKAKKQKMKEIIQAMEAFNENLVGGKRLVKMLEREMPVVSVNSTAKSGMN
ncbi:hypothetical protein GUITHDRAFT_104329 [Guillardia theta CCMP2712]|uniref:Uncharacterized protein n=1 Tax=Guillardia theta (strain CCMP2712) TaxID=905079 RepID=L1JNB4_GUITC|nr:hypothetical protein GUITHDRAFT_104329 [Guillardia theta CCMP2712]EKX49932.1 hypothetical protein GUITHDRAFT_104329 [Guillardia theta CCMP2712]|eukprot:XP_005836912.1 hypothetical protein GUITHDRAFT_104329 [Guillardia theta CCMP2712]